MYVFNSVFNTKLPAILSHQRSTAVSLETFLPPLFMYTTDSTLINNPLIHSADMLLTVMSNLTVKLSAECQLTY